MAPAEEILAGQENDLLFPRSHTICNQPAALKADSSVTNATEFANDFRFQIRELSNINRVLPLNLMNALIPY